MPKTVVLEAIAGMDLTRFAYPPSGHLSHVAAAGYNSAGCR